MKEKRRQSERKGGREGGWERGWERVRVGRWKDGWGVEERRVCEDTNSTERGKDDDMLEEACRRMSLHAC